ncbi:MAG: TonB family protein [Candidatus Omnitrophica bacterium]|jgi:pilus assembly protein CpaC|nr:TonB family protein [Candidatus Omnitrophota bacterium]
MKGTLLRILVVLFLLSVVKVYSQDPFSLDSSGSYTEEISMVIGEIVVLKVSLPSRVSVRNPDILEVSEVLDKEITIAAKQRGNTVLTVWDSEGTKDFYISVQSEDLQMIKRRLKKLIQEDLKIKNVRFEDNEAVGKIVVAGKVSSYEKDQIEKILSSFIDDLGNSLVIDNLLTIKEESKMVEIECQILELTKSLAQTIGFDWTGEPSSTPTPTTTLTEAITGKAAATGGNLKDVFRIVDWTRTALDVDIMAAITDGKGKILARPKLLCLSGEEANFLVGGEIPVVTVTATSQGDTVAENIEYKEYGVKLNIRPVVSQDDTIKLNLTTEVKELSTEGQYTRSDGTIIKAFTTRNASTVLLLKPGQGIMISGLFKDKVTKDDINKVPGLGNLPILGALFRSKDYQDDQTELVISLTPKLVGSSEEAKDEKPIKEIKNQPQNKLAVYPEYLQKDEILNDYILRIQRMIFQALDYPRLAKEAGWQGAVKIKVHLNYKGEVIEARVAESSGYNFFDNNVLEVTKSLSPFPPFPPSIDIEDLWVDIPVVYKMD